MVEGTLTQLLLLKIASKGYERYQPTIQMGAGVASVLLFAATLGAYKKHVANAQVSEPSSTRLADGAIPVGLSRRRRRWRRSGG